MQSKTLKNPKTGKTVTKKKMTHCHNCHKEFHDVDDAKLCPSCEKKADEPLEEGAGAMETLRRNKLVIKAYREMATQMIKSFVPADNQDFSLKFLDTIEKSPEKALQDLSAQMKEGMAKLDPTRKMDMKQDAWSAAKPKSPQELAKEKELQKRMKAGKDTYSQGKPDWLVEATKKAIEEVVKKRKAKGCGK